MAVISSFFLTSHFPWESRVVWWVVNESLKNHCLWVLFWVDILCFYSCIKFSTWLIDTFVDFHPNFFPLALFISNVTHFFFFYSFDFFFFNLSLCFLVPNFPSPSIFTSSPPKPLTSRVFTSGPEDRGSIPGRVITNTQKMVLDAA